MSCRATRANKPETFAPPDQISDDQNLRRLGNTAKIGGSPYTECDGAGSAAPSYSFL
jgi:hypothetical protein